MGCGREDFHPNLSFIPFHTCLFPSMHAIWEEEREREGKQKIQVPERRFSPGYGVEKTMAKDKCYDNQHSEQRQKAKV